MLSERDSMRIPDLPKNRCVNHPTVQAVKKRLCAPCLEKWERSVLSFEAIQQGEVLSPE